MQKPFGVILLAALAVPVSARHSSGKLTGDPNRMICRSEEVVGSRLQTKKTCMTAVQWDQLEREQRASVERIQAYKPNNGN